MTHLSLLDKDFMSQQQINNKVGFVSLGCPKALVDSERILTQLRTDGYEIVPEYSLADLVVVNTCGFIEHAIEESLDAIGEALHENGKVIVTGCLGAKPEKIQRDYPQVLEITGAHDYEGVIKAVNKHLPKPEHNPFLHLVPTQGVKLTPRHYAYLKISEGCNHHCTFCIIPSMRGKLVSRGISDVLREAERLAQAGVKELLVISQDTSAYGLDKKYASEQWRNKEYKTQLDDLCKGLGELGLWVRLHYVYPYPHVDNIIPLMAEGKILPYLDIPFQHASQRVLRAMKRPASSENTLNRIKKWREICPELTIRSTFIVGFPGETEEDFQELLDFLEEAQLDRVGCFKYSPVEGAVANQLANPVPEEIQEDRLKRFMEKQASISTRILEKKLGSVIDVIIDDIDETGAIGRSIADAPEIDGNVFLDDEITLKPGQIVKAKVIDYSEHDLWAEKIIL